MTNDEFTLKYGDKIEKALIRFAFNNAGLLPEFLLGIHEPKKIMLDILKVYQMDMFLPVTVRSASWLAEINFIKDPRALKLFLHEENWPLANRFEIIGGLTEISRNTPEKTLYDYLEKFIIFWERKGKPCPVSISERVATIAESEGNMELLKKVQIVKLSEAYKQAEIIF